MDLCRKKGIESIEVDGVKLTLGKLELKPSKQPGIQESAPHYTPEDILNWSSTPLDGVL